VNSELGRIVLLTQHQEESLRAYVGSAWRNEVTFASDFEACAAGPNKGTADAVYRAFPLIERENPEYILVLASDHVYTMDYRRMLDFHTNKNAAVTVGAVEVACDRASSFGVMEAAPDDRVTAFEEKPNRPQMIGTRLCVSLVSMGIYLFNRAPLVDAVRWNAIHSESSHDFGRDIMPSLCRDGLLYAYNFSRENRNGSGYWRDVGTVDDYYEANMDLLGPQPKLALRDQQWPIRKYGGQDGTERRGTVEHSILSRNVSINSRAYVGGSILFEGVRIGRGARVRRAIIEEGVEIPGGMEIGFDIAEDGKRFVISRNGIVVVPRQDNLQHPFSPGLRALFASRVAEGAVQSRAFHAIGPCGVAERGQ
jgi:glucose-1-phosphate adenylyltransferase